MSWFKRKPTPQKEVEAAIKVASNLYLHTVPEAEDAPGPVEFSLPDSRYRYLIFCVGAMMAACGREMGNCDKVANECLHFVVTWTTTETEAEFFGGPMNPQDAANNGARYFQEFLNGWSQYIELKKESKNAEIAALICSMIHSAESNSPIQAQDMERLGELASRIDDWVPSMRDAFKELTLPA